MNLLVEVEGWRLEGEEPFLAWLEAEARREGFNGDISLVFLDNDGIAGLNRDFLGHEGPTDVISFNLEDEEGDLFVEPGNDEPELGETAFPAGEVYVSLERADQQAVEYKASLTEEVSRLALHGVLHLAGWLDGDAAQRSEMSRREDEGLARARGKDDTFPWMILRPAEQEGIF